MYLDFGPVFEDWEADFGRTYVVGSDPYKHRLVRDLGLAFARGKIFYQQSPKLTAGELFDFTAALAADYGWEFGALTAGHLIGHFPHETKPQDPDRLRIRHGNSISLREPDEKVGRATGFWNFNPHRPPARNRRFLRGTVDLGRAVRANPRDDSAPRYRPTRP